MSGLYGERPRPQPPRRPGPDDPTVQFPRPSRPRPAPPPRGSDGSGEEPWWRTVNREPDAPRAVPRRPAAPPAAREAAPRPPATTPKGRPPVRTPAAPPTPARAATTRRTLSPGWIVAAVIAVLLAGIGLGIGMSTLNPVRDNVLDVSKVEEDVTGILLDPVDGYGVTGLTEVTCNGGDDPVVRTGSEFRCEVVVDGRTRSVLVVFQDDAGTYAVDRPR
ncbi:DUF4333 domain-containing protein [Mycolicibacterium thermoresistibile]